MKSEALEDADKLHTWILKKKIGIWLHKIRSVYFFFLSKI